MKEDNELYKFTLTKNSYISMVNRCHNYKNTSFQYYGGQGITVCDKWRKDMGNFIKDMGFRPSKEYSIDRKNVRLGFTKSNCVWKLRTRASYEDMIANAAADYEGR